MKPHRLVNSAMILTIVLGSLGLTGFSASASPVESSAAKGPPVWRDGFDSSSLDPAWYWVNETPGAWSLAENPGFMQIQVSSAYTGGENLLLRSGAEGNFTIETRVVFKPTANYQFAGLVIYQDGGSYVQLGRGYCDIPDECVIGNGIYFNNIQNGGLVGDNYHRSTGDTLDKAFLRLELNGRKITAFYSDGGAAWQKIGQHTLPAKFQVTGVGLAASQDIFRLPDAPIPVAAFDYFSMTGKPKPSSPFVGAWQAVDADGGAMRLAIGGPQLGPFHITWQEGYLGYCDGEAGIGRGTGRLDPIDPYVLNGEILLECLTGVSDPLMMNPTWHYDPAKDTITAYGGEGETNTVWHRPGNPPPPPDWIIIGRPADDGVDGGYFPEGTVVSVLVLDDEHNTRWYGTDTARYSDWDPDHAWVQYAVDADLMPGDHVWMYDGTNAKELLVSSLVVTTVDLATYTVSGSAEPGSEVFVDLPGGTTEVTSGSDGFWSAPFDDSALGQSLGAYQPDADNDQTRAIFYVPNPRIVASGEGNWFWTTEFPANAELAWSILVDDDRCDVPDTCHGQATSDEWGFISVGLAMDLGAGDVLTVTGGASEKVLEIEEITIDTFDLDEGYMAGTAGPEGRPIYVVASPSPEASYQHTMVVYADKDKRWFADFDVRFTENPDLWRGWSFAQIFDEDGDANEAGVPPEPEPWVWHFTLDFPGGTWTSGEHSYYFTMTSSDGGGDSTARIFNVLDEVPRYPNYVLLDPWKSVANTGAGCEAITVVQREQLTRFRWGWVTDEPMTRDAAQALYESMHVWVIWDAGDPVEMERHELLEADEMDEGYVCSLTEP